MKKNVKLLYEFVKIQALCCIFPVSVFAILAITKLYDFPIIPRYDLILILCILVQIILIRFKLETIDELKVIMIFHLVGVVLEIYKIKMGSWSYPEDGIFKVGNVPLYSGFMYSSVASYVFQATKRLKLNFINWPGMITTFVMAAITYLNFFTHHFFYDFRWLIILLLLVVFRKCVVEFQLGHEKFKMPIALSYLLIGFFIWIAENIATFWGAWTYPNQLNHWELVHTSKISSWFLLVIISIIIVVNLKDIASTKQNVSVKKSLFKYLQ